MKKLKKNLKQSEKIEKIEKIEKNDRYFLLLSYLYMYYICIIHEIWINHKNGYFMCYSSLFNSLSLYK